MFFHCFKYGCLEAVRQKEIVFWVVIFPIILGLLFKVAFGSVTEKTKFDTIEVAVVVSDENEMFKSVMDGLSEGDEALFKTSYCEEKKALELLENKDVAGVIYGDELEVTVSQSGIEQTIIKQFIVEYKANVSVISDTIKTNPQKLSEVTEMMNSELKANNEVKLIDGDYDPMVSYFYNLIAMTALFGAYMGIFIPIRNQANISQLGARKSCSPIKKSVAISASLCSAIFVQTICMIICVSYLRFVLGIDFGDKLIMVYITAIFSGWVGVALGFFVGSIGKMGEAAKIGLYTAVSLFLCFLSGLMVMNMKQNLEKIGLGWFNKINPAAVISDAFYCLNVYDDYEVYTTKIITMAITIVIFAVLGFIMTRKRKFKSL